MKKILLLSLLVMGVALLSAQSRWAFGLDVEAGLSGERSTQEDYYPNPEFGDYVYNSIARHRPGLSAGVWAEYLLSHRFGLRLGANYARLHHFEENENMSYGTMGNLLYYSRNRQEVEQTQLRVPLEGKLYFGRSDRPWRVFTSLGVEASYVLTQTDNSESLSGGAGQPETYESAFVKQMDFSNPDYALNRAQTSIIGGFGIQTSSFTLSLQRTWGLSGVQSYYSNCYGIVCGFGEFNSFYPYGYGGTLRRLNMTSLRFAYRLF